MVASRLSFVLSIPTLALFSMLMLLTHDKIAKTGTRGSWHIEQPPRVTMLAVADESFQMSYSSLFDKMARYASTHGYT